MASSLPISRSSKSRYRLKNFHSDGGNIDGVKLSQDKQGLSDRSVKKMADDLLTCVQRQKEIALFMPRAASSPGRVS